VDNAPYYAVYRIVHLALDRWSEIDGEAALKGVDLRDLPVDRFLNAVYAWCCSRIHSEEDREEFDTRLVAAPPGSSSIIAAQQEMESFSQFAAMFGVTETWLLAIASVVSMSRSSPTRRG
jgi:hypothetical protein